jgi:hypothetical protein
MSAGYFREIRARGLETGTVICVEPKTTEVSLGERIRFWGTAVVYRQKATERVDSETNSRATRGFIKKSLSRLIATSVWGNDFEAVAMQMVCEFPGELVEAVEVSAEVIAAVGRPDESSVVAPVKAVPTRAVSYSTARDRPR